MSRRNQKKQNKARHQRFLEKTRLPPYTLCVASYYEPPDTEKVVRMTATVTDTKTDRMIERIVFDFDQNIDGFCEKIAQYIESVPDKTTIDVKNLPDGIRQYVDKFIDKKVQDIDDFSDQVIELALKYKASVSHIDRSVPLEKCPCGCDNYLDQVITSEDLTRKWKDQKYNIIRE